MRAVERIKNDSFHGYLLFYVLFVRLDIWRQCDARYRLLLLNLKKVENKQVGLQLTTT
jgi:hypothetical protein